jgi:hypothetical protein
MAIGFFFNGIPASKYYLGKTQVNKIVYGAAEIYDRFAANRMNTGFFTLTMKDVVAIGPVRPSAILNTGFFTLTGFPVTLTPPPVGHRYWRVNVSAAAAAGGTGTVNVGECEMAIAAAGANQSTVGANAAASSAVGGRGANLAFDASLASTSFWAASAALPQWLSYDFGVGNAKTLYEVRIAVHTLARYPSTFTIEFSDDNAAWTVKNTYTGITTWVVDTYKTFVL